ncbi:MAG: hypothetical protein KDA74_17790, partial [Planctomycetaceae bacterium]|nr:hypothetical protein [Planctomycetaceae bacterium]
WRRGLNYAEGDRVLFPAQGSYEFTPYDRVYVCTTAGQSGADYTVFRTAAARVEGASVTESTGVVWRTELNTTPSLLTIFTRTGNVSAYPLYFDLPGNISPDVFYYAETGEMAK